MCNKQRIVIAGPHPLEDERVMSNGSIRILKDARKAQRAEQGKAASEINLPKVVLALGAAKLQLLFEKS